MVLEHSPARAGVSFSAPDASLTIAEFCQAEKISRSMLYRAWSEGWGPRFRTQSPSDSDMEADAFSHVRGRRHRDNEIRFLTIAEVAERLRVSTRTVRRWIKDGVVLRRTGWGQFKEVGSARERSDLDAPKRRLQ